MDGYIYIIQSEKNGRYYIGSSSNLSRRLEEHNRGKSKYTSESGPWKLVFSQEYKNITIARKIERKLKQMKSKVILEKIIYSKNCNIQID